jgi:hypothetical protein
LSFNRFLSMLEKHPELTIPSRVLAEVLDPEPALALCAAGVLAPAGPATWYPCARRLRSCRRTVAVDGAELHLLCGRGDGRCDPEVVPAREYGQHALDEAALVRVLQDLFGTTGDTPRREGCGQPLWLGRTPGGAVELWLWLRPQEPDFSDWVGDLGQRHGRPERTLVLVPTDRHIRIDTFPRHGPGQPVQIVDLHGALALDGGRIVVRVSRPAQEPVLWSDDATSAQVGMTTRLRVPPGVRWSHITIEHIENDFLGVRVGAHPPIRVTAAELRLTRESTGKLSDLGVLLCALCADGGRTTRAAVGAPNVRALRVQATRLSDVLCAAFGIRATPLHVDGKTETVYADFIALPEPRRTLRRRERREREDGS